MSFSITPRPQNAAKRSQENHHVHCPHCGEGFDLTEAMLHHHNEAIQSHVESQVAGRLAELDALRTKVQKQEEALASEVATQVAQRLETESAKMREAWDKEQLAKNQVQSEHLSELREKAKKGAALEAKLIQLEANQELALAEARAEAEIAVAKVHASEMLEQKARLETASKLETQALERQLLTLKESLADAERKASLGSQQEQGEVQELVLEDVLQKAFPKDFVEEVGKGIRGADCQLRILDPNNPSSKCSILFESKRTKNFQKAWVAKFKEDILTSGADVGILVTEAMPNGSAKPTQLEGVFICQLKDVHFVASVIRSGLLRFSSALQAQQCKAGKVELLYDYMTGPAFKHTWENVRNQYVQLRDSHESRKRTFLQRWNREEKMLASAEQSVIDFMNSVLDIGGSSIDLLPVYAEDSSDFPESAEESAD